MKPGAIWSFIAGDSRRAPAAVAAAVVVTLVLQRCAPAGWPGTGPLYVAVIAAGLVAGVFERTG